jgi:hypothetical protein
VLSLKNLIVRDIANQERGMFLISDSTPPEMYELHGASRDDRNNWMRLIQQTVSRSATVILTNLLNSFRPLPILILRILQLSLMES